MVKCRYIAVAFLALLLAGCAKKSGTMPTCSVILNSQDGSQSVKLFETSQQSKYAAFVTCGGNSSPIMVGMYDKCLNAITDAGAVSSLFTSYCGGVMDRGNLDSGTTAVPISTSSAGPKTVGPTQAPVTTAKTVSVAPVTSGAPTEASTAPTSVSVQTLPPTAASTDPPTTVPATTAIASTTTASTTVSESTSTTERSTTASTARETTSRTSTVTAVKKTAPTFTTVGSSTTETVPVSSDEPLSDMPTLRRRHSF